MSQMYMVIGYHTDTMQRFAQSVCAHSANAIIQREGWMQICSSMDLTPAQVNSLFDRADAVWEHSKEVVCYKS